MLRQRATRGRSSPPASEYGAWPRCSREARHRGRGRAGALAWGGSLPTWRNWQRTRLVIEWLGVRVPPSALLHEHGASWQTGLEQQRAPSPAPWCVEPPRLRRGGLAVPVDLRCARLHRVAPSGADGLRVRRAPPQPAALPRAVLRVGVGRGGAARADHRHRGREPQPHAASPPAVARLQAVGQQPFAELVPFRRPTLRVVGSGGLGVSRHRAPFACCTGYPLRPRAMCVEMNTRRGGRRVTSATARRTGG
jgi:hypothetical protein